MESFSSERTHRTPSEIERLLDGEKQTFDDQSENIWKPFNGIKKGTTLKVKANTDSKHNNYVDNQEGTVVSLRTTKKIG
jgi:hypothetical protein